MRIPSPSTLLALAVSLSFGMARADEPKSLDALLNEYRELGLPFPPKDAKLVRLAWDSGQKTGPKKYSLEFMTKPATKSQRPELFSIWFERQLDRDKKIEDANPDIMALNDVPPAGVDDLLLAVQCQARGWNALAKALLERYLKESETPPSKQLVELSWEYWVKQLSEPKVDRAPIAKRLKELIDKNEDLNKQPNRTLLNALNLALVPSKAKAGSIEALIDDLVNYNSEDDLDGPLDWKYKPESRYWRVAKLGFEAVPPLIEHLDDLRLTRSVGGALFNNWSPYNEQVRHVVSRLLEGLAGDLLGRDGLDPLRGNPSEKDAALKWWEPAKKVGEERYLMEHVIRKTDSGVSQDGINILMLNLIVAKYPKQVPELFRAALKKNPNTECWIWVDALLDCNLPEKEKLELLLDIYQKANVNRRISVLHGIGALGKERYVSLLLAMLDETPADEFGRWSESDIENVVSMAAQSDDARIQSKSEKVVRRAKPALRVKLLHQLVWPEKDAGWFSRLRFLEKFLDDSSDSHGWPRKGDNLEIRNVVAYYMARMLEIDSNIDQLRTIEDWAKFRSRVQESLKRELRKPPNPNP